MKTKQRGRAVRKRTISVSGVPDDVLAKSRRYIADHPEEFRSLSHYIVEAMRRVFMSGNRTQ